MKTETKHTLERPLNAKLNKAPDDGSPFFFIETPLGQIVARCNNAWGEYFLNAVNAHDERNRRAELFPELVAALERLYEETADYIRINNLGDVHHNQSMKNAVAALAKAKEA